MHVRVIVNEFVCLYAMMMNVMWMNVMWMDVF